MSVLKCNLSQHIFPTLFKQAAFFPIFKQRKTALDNNYTPISIPKTFSQIFEITIHVTFHTILPLEYNKCPLNSSLFGPHRRTDVLESNNNYVFINLLQCKEMFCCVRKYSLLTVASVLCIAQLEQVLISVPIAMLHN